MKKNSWQANQIKEQYSENTTPNKDSIKTPIGVAKRDVSLFLDLFTRIMKKEDSEKCICHPSFDKVDNISVFHENELVTGISITQNKNNQIKFDEIISGLRLLGYPVTGSLVSIYCSKINDYIYLGADPLDSNLLLDSSEFENLNLLKIKMTAFIEEKVLNNHTAFSQIFEEKTANPNNNLANLNTNNSKNSQVQGKTNNPNNASSKEDKKALNANKRTKERKIGYIIEKVNTWRKYYNGYYDEKGNFTKFSLDEAAKKIDISKKSLDDYLLQLRLGRKYGFDFNLHKNDKVGILRAFVKDHRKKLAD